MGSCRAASSGRSGISQSGHSIEHDPADNGAAPLVAEQDPIAAVASPRGRPDGEVECPGRSDSPVGSGSGSGG